MGIAKYRRPDSMTDDDIRERNKRYFEQRGYMPDEFKEEMKKKRKRGVSKRKSQLEDYYTQLESLK